jgi:Leucine-rich repeat (LRR) protein
MATGRRKSARFQKSASIVDVNSDQFTEALRRIDAAKQEGARSLELSIEGLRELPPQIASLSTLKVLSITGTEISDLAPLANHKTLQKLFLGHSKVADLTPLTCLANLRELYIHGTEVIDLAPIANLTKLRVLTLPDGKIKNLLPISRLQALRRLNYGDAPNEIVIVISNLTDLRDLELRNAAVSDLRFVRHLAALRCLHIAGTQVTNLAPLQRITTMEQLWVSETPITDLTPIAGLSKLKSLMLDGTQVSDLTPIARLLRLETLYFNNTLVDDLNPIANLIKLKTLSFDQTPVNNLGPISRLSDLRYLSLAETEVDDLGPVAGLIALQGLSVGRTQVDDLAPISHLTALQSLSLDETRVNDLHPISGLTALQSLSLDRTQIDDLAPISAFTALQHLSLNGAPVSNLDPIAGLGGLQELELSNTRVSDLTTVARFTSLQTAAVEDSEPRTQGINYAGSPVSRQPPFSGLVRLPQPGLTVETINAVRREQSLPEHVPEGYERPANLDEMLRPRAPTEEDASSDTETAAALEQRPATYSFPYSAGRFRAQAQISPPADLALATDIHADLRTKALEARDRLASSNAPKRVRETIDRLLADLGASLGDVSPGKLLMRSRSLDADVAAYDTIEARREIAEDALAQVIDVAASVADLKSCYPAITRLEAARVAQDLLTKDVGATLQHMVAIRDVAAASDIVDSSAVEALKVGEPEIEHANEIIEDKEIGEAARVVAMEKRAETAAQMLLDHRNFVASVLKTASNLYDRTRPAAAAIAKGVAKIASKTGRDVVKKAPGPLSDAIVATGVGALAGAVLGPTVGLAAFLATYKPLAKKASQFVKAATVLAKSVRRKQSGDPDDDSADEDASDRG